MENIKLFYELTNNTVLNKYYKLCSRSLYVFAVIIMYNNAPQSLLLFPKYFIRLSLHLICGPLTLLHHCFDKVSNFSKSAMAVSRISSLFSTHFVFSSLISKSYSATLSNRQPKHQFSPVCQPQPT